MSKLDKDDLVNLSGQVVNGMMSADSSFWIKMFDRAEHKQIAHLAVDIAVKMLEKINEIADAKEDT